MIQASMGNPLQRRLTSFGVNIIVMALCFMLYYLGFFGGVDGPLTMTNIGKGIAGLGITSAGFHAILFILFIIALTWNWVVNLLAHLTGQRLTCTEGSKEKGFCGRLVKRSRNLQQKDWIYTCPNGHCRTHAHFHPVKKGTFANSVLMVTLVAWLMYYAR